MRAIALLLLLSLSACGGSDAPTAPPTPPAPIAVRIQTAAVSGAIFDQLAITVNNAGGAGQYRIAAYDDATPGRFVGAPITFAPRRRCESTPVLINPGVTNSQTFVCQPGLIYWVVVEVQDGSSAAWVRTACYAETRITTLPSATVCDAALKPER